MPKPFNVAILVCDNLSQEDTVKSGSLSKRFSDLLYPASDRYEFASYAAHLGQLPQTPQNYDGYIITGSSADAFSDVDWVLSLGDFIAKAAKLRPIVGVCFGHQLLHHKLGGHVARAPDGWRIGTQSYSIKDCPDFIGTSADNFDLLASHQDQVLSPAPNSKILAHSPTCPVAMTTIGGNIFTIQPHPEFTPQIAASLYERRQERLGKELFTTAMASLNQPLSDNLVASWITSFFLNHHTQKQR
jgi:GMP synthase-like glutamine amidotransferase